MYTTKTLLSKASKSNFMVRYTWYGYSQYPYIFAQGEFLNLGYLMNPKNNIAHLIELK